MSVRMMPPGTHWSENQLGDDRRRRVSAGGDGGGSSGKSGDGGSEDGTGDAGRGGGGRTTDVMFGGGVEFAEDRSADGAERVADYLLIRPPIFTSTNNTGIYY